MKDFESEFPDALPATLKKRCASFHNKHDFAESLVDNHALFHKDCTSAYNKSKLAQKRKWKEIDQGDENGQNENSDEIMRKSTRKSLNLSNFTSLCFFCEEDDSETKLRQCQTFSVQQKVKLIAEETHDTKILAKLSEGDMIATEAKYHCKCLLSYYSKASSVTSPDMQHDIKMICGIVLETDFFVHVFVVVVVVVVD